MFLLTLDEWWQLLSPAQHIFWILAIVSSAFFVFMFGFSLLGLGDSDVDIDADVDMDVDHGTSHDYHVDKDFSAFSLRSIVAFLTFFSWTGVYYLSRGHSLLYSSFAGLLAGGAAMFVAAYMIYKFAQLEKSGTMNPVNALEKTGEVYLTIPQNLEGRGKIHLIVDGSLHEFDAETRGNLLKTGSPVKVIEILDDDILLVEPIILEAER